MPNAIDLSTLDAYVQQERLPLIREAILEGRSARLFSLQSGIKTRAMLNLLSTDVTFGDGTVCDSDYKEAQSLTQRELVTGAISIDLEYCYRSFLEAWTQREVDIITGREKLPFAEALTSAVVEDVQAKLEVAIYQGNTASSDANLNKFDGLLKILEAESGTVKTTTTFSATSATPVYDQIKTIKAAIPAEAYKRGDVAILVGSDVFSLFVDDMVEKNYFHYNPGEPVAELRFPGNRVRIIAVDGLTDTNKVIGASLRNIFYGTDMMNAKEEFDLWYDKSSKKFKLNMWFNAGVQVAFPDEIVVGTVALSA